MNRFMKAAQPSRPAVKARNNNGILQDCSQIPDLWNIAAALPEDQNEAIIHVWGNAHCMRDQLSKIQNGRMGSEAQPVGFGINQDGELSVEDGQGNTLVKFTKVETIRIHALLELCRVKSKE